ncbi:MAG TPA: hypothetical protein VFC78_19580 [Tepidisphaeraceae bacterium]|nr:hypothetical protein [Tepidisphaeraceae bacterium]
MSNRSRLLMMAALVGLAVCAPCAWGQQAPQTQPAQTSTADEIKTLRARLDQLEAQQKEAEQKRQEDKRQADDAAINRALSKDAKDHSRLLDVEGFTAGYNNNRFGIQSADGKFAFRPWMHFQLRDITMDRQNFKAGNDQLDNGLELRRVKWGIDGNMFGTDLTYFFNWSTARTSGNQNVVNAAGTKIGTTGNSLGGVPLLEEAWTKYHFRDTPFYVVGGQIHDPVYHDSITSTRYQHGAERSLTGNIFGNADTFTEAVGLIFDPNTNIRTTTVLNHGMRSANTNFLDTGSSGGYNRYDYGVAGRVEYKVMGRWSDYSQVGAVDDKEPLLVFGSGADYSESGHTGQTVAAVDGMYGDPSGLSFFGAVLDRYTTHNFGIYTQTPTGASSLAADPAVAGRATNEYSLLFESGYIFNHTWEPYARYEYMRLQGTPAGSHNYVQEITGGVNYYIHGYRAKFTLEGKYLPNGIPLDDGGSDVLASPGGRGEFVFTAQLQLLL